VLPKSNCPGLNQAIPTSPVELTPRMPEKSDDDVPVLVRRVNRRPEVFAVVLSISSLAFGVVVQMPSLPFESMVIACVVPILKAYPIAPVFVALPPII
jgi:hypothetical protein